MSDDEPRFVIAHNLAVRDEPWIVFDRRDAKGSAAGWAAAEKIMRELEEKEGKTQ